MHEFAAAESVQRFVLERVRDEGYESPDRVEVVAGPGYSADSVAAGLETLLPGCEVVVRDEVCPGCGEVARSSPCSCGEELERGCRVASIEVGGGKD